MRTRRTCSRSRRITCGSSMTARHTTSAALRPSSCCSATPRATTARAACAPAPTAALPHPAPYALPSGARVRVRQLRRYMLDKRQLGWLPPHFGREPRPADKDDLEVHGGSDPVPPPVHHNCNHNCSRPARRRSPQSRPPNLNS